MNSDLRLSVAIPQWGIDLALMALVGLFFGLIGPFGTDSAPLDRRMLYWIVVMPVGGSLVLLTELLIGRTQLARRPAFNLIAVALLAAVPQTLAVILTGWAVFGLPHPAPPSTVQMLMAFGSSYIAVAVVMFAMVPLIRLARRRLPAARPGPAPPASAPILQRLPYNLQGSDLIALEAEDHYVRVHTVAGSELVLIRLTDAIAETAPVAGYRTHRSWWFAADALDSANFKRGAGTVMLKTGLNVPISRTYAPALREARII